MKNPGRILLILGVAVLALLAGILAGRAQRGQPAAAGNALVQITSAPAEPAPAPTPLPVLPPPPPQPPQPPAAPIPAIAPDQQVQEDAAAVGMTTREGAEAGQAEHQQDTSAQSASSGDEPAPPPPPPHG